MLTIPCTIVLLICTVVCVRHVRNLDYRFGEFAFFSSFGLIFGLAPIMQSSDSYVNIFSMDSRVKAAWYTVAGVLLLMVGFGLIRQPLWQLIPKKRALLKKISEPHVQRMLANIFWLSIAITISGQLLVMYAKGISLLDILYSGRFAFRFENQGVLTVLASHLMSFVYAPAFIGVFLNRRYQLLTLAYVPIASGVFFFVFSKGTRSIPLALIVTLLVAGSIRFKVSPKRVAMTAIVGLVSLALAIGLFELRQRQDSVSLLEGAKILCTATAYSGMWDRDPLSYSWNLVGAIETFPHSHPYLDAATYRRMLVFFLQESKFPDLKPPDTNIIFGLEVHGRPEELQVTVPPSILGDIYINFWGWYGLPVVVLHGMLYCWLLQRMQTSLFMFIWVGPLSGRFLVLIHRGEPYEMFVLFVMFFFEMAGVYSFCKLVASGTQRRRRTSTMRNPSKRLPVARPYLKHQPSGYLSTRSGNSRPFRPGKGTL